MLHYALAIDIGASSGRHVLGWQENGEVQTREIYRFSNGIVTQNGHDCWDVDQLFFHIVEGMKQCGKQGFIPQTVAIDTWGVDYVLLDKDGVLIGDAVSYRDRRTETMPMELEKRLPFETHYQKTGIAKQPYNSVYQLMAQLAGCPDVMRRAAHLLFLPCYFSYLLCGVAKNEYTVSSTSGLLNAETRNWDADVLSAIGISSKIFCGAPVPPGTRLGSLLPEIRQRVGYNCQVLLTAAHDTAGAFFAVPVASEKTVFLSSGTWSLLGARLKRPMLSRAAMQAGFTNEGGVNCIRFLKNIMGLWILQEIRREWQGRLTFGEMAALAETASCFKPVFDVTDPRFLKPLSMVEEIHKALAEQHAPPPSDAELLFCVNHSLAVSYGKAVTGLKEVLNAEFDRIMILGGGNQNRLLNKLTENETGLPVTIGPTEGSALGNLNVQFAMFEGGNAKTATVPYSPK